jgi:hypothetical protein
MVKYTLNITQETRNELEQFSKDSGFMVCEIVRGLQE